MATNLDGSTELGERVRLLLGVGGGRGLTLLDLLGLLGLLAEGEGERRLALVGLDLGLLLAVNDGRGLCRGGLDGDSSRARDIGAQRLSSLRLGDDRSVLR